MRGEGTLDTKKSKRPPCFPAARSIWQSHHVSGSKMFISTTVIGLGLYIFLKNPSQDRHFCRNCSSPSANTYSNIQISQGQTMDFVSSNPHRKQSAPSDSPSSKACDIIFWWSDVRQQRHSCYGPFLRTPVFQNFACISIFKLTFRVVVHRYSLEINMWRCFANT